MSRNRRSELLSPFAGDHAGSVARRAAPPKGIAGLLAWFLEGFRAEVPERVHTIGVWRDYVRLDEDRRAEGGSLLGSPRLADPFRAFLEGSPFAVEPAEFEGHKSADGDEHYVTPIRAALARLNGRHFCSPLERQVPSHDCPENATIARLLYRIALRDGAWESAALEFVQPSLRRLVVGESLFRLWRTYDTMPPARLLEQKEVAVA